MRRSSALVAAIVCASSSVAAADGKAWKAARDNLPDKPLVLGADVEALSKSAVWAHLMPKLVGRDDIKQGLATIKSVCNIDVTTAVTSLVIAADPSPGKVNDVAAYIAIPSIGKAKALACLQAVAADRAKQSTDPSDKGVVSVKPDGNLVELNDGHQTIYVGFLGDVVVLVSPEHWNDKAAVKSWLAGAGALSKGETGKLIAKTNTRSALFAGTTMVDQLGDAQGAHQVYAWASFAAGKMAAEVHADFGDATVAQSQTDDVTKKIADMGNVPLPAVKSFFSGMSAARSGNELVVKETAAETDVVALLDLALTMLH
jgi:hypothetical protein